jgi:hypothetical protein
MPTLARHVIAAALARVRTTVDAEETTARVHD